ncbi:MULTISPECIES: transposase [unclassified Oceanobacillus]|uniref:transposase n=1 Tax=unclassified Oceanobacillus TaxID=2630292 RepID=UPI001BE7853B|nr:MULTISPECIES: transposase [unclassified Oceanobacillus]MBT2599110.1 transposase [Oceanobacillus sp. ISL-74]MBT2652028.1 transposase [Oceanobacillus sp. ISL-73]
MDKEIREIGSQLEDNPRKQQKIKALLAKGSDMTFSDVRLLKEMEVTKKTIFNAMGIKSSSRISTIDISSADKFYKSLENVNQKKAFKKKSEGKVVAKFNMTVNEFIKLKHEKGMSVAAIAKKKGVSDVTVYKWVKEHKKEIEKASKDTAVPEKKNIPVLPEVPKDVEYKKLQEEHEKLKVEYADSKKDLETWKNQVAQKNAIIKELQLKLEKIEDHLDPSESIQTLMGRYQKEKSAHAYLFKYVSLIQEDLV